MVVNQKTSMLKGSAGILDLPPIQKTQQKKLKEKWVGKIIFRGFPWFSMSKNKSQATNIGTNFRRVTQSSVLKLLGSWETWNLMVDGWWSWWWKSINHVKQMWNTRKRNKEQHIDQCKNIRSQTMSDSGKNETDGEGPVPRPNYFQLPGTSGYQVTQLLELYALLGNQSTLILDVGPSWSLRFWLSQDLAKIGRHWSRC